MTAGVSATGRDAAQAMTHGFLLAPDDPRWADVSTVITWTAIGVFLQGFYLLTSIGLNITKQTQYYPLATISAAAINILLNFLLIPRFGIVGAAWANGAGYAVQAGARLRVRAALLSRSPYEWGRLLRVCAAARRGRVAAHAAAAHVTLAVSARSMLAPLPDLLARGVTVVLVFGGLLGGHRVLPAG